MKELEKPYKNLLDDIDKSSWLSHIFKEARKIWGEAFILSDCYGTRNRVREAEKAYKAYIDRFKDYDKYLREIGYDNS